ncbi:MAG: uridine phosphorylase [Mogibacterium sp.]|nr:uridine phosphorylase [Mogibacterium sp.]
MVDYTEGSGKQYHIGLSPDEIGKYIILPGDPGRCKEIAASLDDAYYVGTNREYTTYTGFIDGVKVSVTSTGIGGPSASIALEELANLGAHTFIRVGTCGGMQMDVKGGDVVIATGSIRMEGTSKEYAPIEFPAVSDPLVTYALIKAIRHIGGNYHIGVVQSKDSFYGQHEASKHPVGPELMYKWDAWLSMGCLASEMESAALFITGAFRRVRVGACFLCIANQERAKTGLENEQVHDTGLPVQTAVKAMQYLIKADKKYGVGHSDAFEML